MPEWTAVAGLLGNGPRLKQSEFEQIRRLAHEKFGLDLKRGKEELVKARLGKKLREGDFRSFRDYYKHVVSDPTGESLTALIDALTTNYTSFLREPAHFEFLAAKLPALRGRGDVEIWCAACATGEEPYTLAFTMLDALQAAPGRRIRILATDISIQALKTARRGIYPAERFEGVPGRWKDKYLSKGRRNWEGYYRVRPEVRELVEFRRLNLIEPFRHPRRFPAIFCRNVMIYFNNPTKEDVVNRLAEWLEVGGYFFVGHAESLTGIQQTLQYVQPALYRKRSLEPRQTRGRGGAA